MNKNGLLILLSFVFMGCGEEYDIIEKPCNRVELKEKYKAYSKLIYQRRSSFYLRPGFDINISFRDSISELLELTCEDVINSIEFIEFRNIYILNEAINDYKCCNQGYDIKTGIFPRDSILIKSLLEEIGVNYKEKEVFISDEIFRYAELIERQGTDTVRAMLNELRKVFNKEIEFI